MASAEKKPYFQGVLEHKQGGNKEKYLRLFVCLVGRHILIYDDFNKNKMLGKLTLDIGTKVKLKEKNGHRIELTTRDFDSKGMAVPRRNVFRSESKSDRDIWYAYIHALTNGQVPANLKLSPAIVMNIQEALQDCIRPVEAAKPNMARRPSAPNVMIPYRQEPAPDYSDHYGTARHPFTTSGQHLSQIYQANLPPVDESAYECRKRPRRGTEPNFEAIAHAVTNYYAEGPLVPTLIPQDQSRFLRNSTSSGESDGSGGQGSRSDGRDDQPGVYKMHKFYTNPNMNMNVNKIPSWFFDNCTREQSELILTMGKKYGNVMMRESTTRRDCGTYAIDVRMETPRGCTMKHYKITQGNGFELSIEDAKNESFSCLTEVMSYMLSSLGPDCRTMSTNNKTLLGIDEPDYDSVLHIDKKPTLRAPSQRKDSAKGLPTPPLSPDWRETGYNSDSDSDTGYLPMDDDPTKIYEEIDDYLQPDPAVDGTPAEVHSNQLQTLHISKQDVKRDVPP